jgi:hypothetical protein
VLLAYSSGCVKVEVAYFRGCTGAAGIFIRLWEGGGSICLQYSICNTLLGVGVEEHTFDAYGW